MSEFKTYEIIVSHNHIKKCSFRVNAIDTAWAWRLSESMIEVLKKQFVKENNKFPITTDINEISGEVIKLKADIIGKTN